MKTFGDIINEADNKDIIKKYVVNGNGVTIRAEYFKSLVIPDEAHNIKTDMQDIIINGKDKKSLKVSLKREKNDISITASEFCSKCNGTGDIECDQCMGSGECECIDCGVIHECGVCKGCLLYTSPSPRDGLLSRMPSSA